MPDMSLAERPWLITASVSWRASRAWTAMQGSFVPRFDRSGCTAVQAARVLLVVLAAVVLAGCRQDMHDNPRYEPLEATTFFSDGRASRGFVANTVARGTLREDTHLYQGRVDGQLATTFPMPVTAQV